MNFSKIGASFLLFVIAWCQYSFAESTEPQQVSNVDSTYTCVMSISDTLCSQDSIFLIRTVCAPICSSHVCVYNKEWQLIGILKAPLKSPFPEAYIENGKILWRDNDAFDYTPIL